MLCYSSTTLHDQALQVSLNPLLKIINKEVREGGEAKEISDSPRVEALIPQTM